MKKDEQRPIVIRPRRKSGGEAHGSSGWKIALADFMTAMLALFMVLWATSLDQETKDSIEAYFQDPVGIKRGYSNGASPISVGTSPAQVRTPVVQALMRAQVEMMQIVGDRIRDRLNSEDALARVGAQVEIVASRDGLRIELIEGGGGDTFFPIGSAVMKPVTRLALAIIAAELTSLDNPVIVEGHTDSAPFGSRADYTNWELSSDRAHAARRIIELNGIGDQRILDVRGYADKQLRASAEPLHPSNRRITILLPLILSTPDTLGAGTLSGAMSSSGLDLPILDPRN
jgi:chemotaxis protein MotB